MSLQCTNVCVSPLNPWPDATAFISPLISEPHLLMHRCLKRHEGRWMHPHIITLFIILPVHQPKRRLTAALWGRHTWKLKVCDFCHKRALLQHKRMKLLGRREEGMVVVIKTKYSEIISNSHKAMPDFCSKSPRSVLSWGELWRGFKRRSDKYMLASGRNSPDSVLKLQCFSVAPEAVASCKS